MVSLHKKSPPPPTFPQQNWPYLISRILTGSFLVSEEGDNLGKESGRGGSQPTIRAKEPKSFF